MTDTTDIKALRERMMQQREAALTGNTPSFEDCELLVCDLLRALTLSNKQLEAERQRADANEGGKNAFNSITRYIEDKQRNETYAIWREVSDRLNADGCNSYSSHVIEYLEVLNGEIENQTAELAAPKGSVGEAKDWEIDHSAGVPILVYKKCSVIESEQAYGLLSLVKQSELKGEQVPVGIWRIQEVTGEEGEISRTEFLSVSEGVSIPKDAPLFTAPQKPVVLPKSFSQSDYLSHGLEPSDAYGLSYGSSEMRALCKKAIEVAGGIVKGC